MHRLSTFVPLPLTACWCDADWQTACCWPTDCPPGWRRHFKAEELFTQRPTGTRHAADRSALQRLNAAQRLVVRASQSTKAMQIPALLAAAEEGYACCQAGSPCAGGASGKAPDGGRQQRHVGALQPGWQAPGVCVPSSGGHLGHAWGHCGSGPHTLAACRLWCASVTAPGSLGQAIHMLTDCGTATCKVHSHWSIVQHHMPRLRTCRSVYSCRQNASRITHHSKYALHLLMSQCVILILSCQLCRPGRY